MLPELNPTANHKMTLIYEFFKKNETIFTIIAIFGALAGFLYNFKTANGENLVSGILFLVILIGLLMSLILYDAVMIIISYTRKNDGTFTTAFQVYFIGLCMALFLLFFLSLISYLYSSYTDLTIWFGILIIWSFFHYLGEPFNKVISGALGKTTRGIILIILVYASILILLLSRIYPFVIIVGTQSIGFIIETHAAQILVFLGIIAMFLFDSLLYFGSPLIKSMFRKKPVS
jgi:hypothetical protein